MSKTESVRKSQNGQVTETESVRIVKVGECKKKSQLESVRECQTGNCHKLKVSDFQGWHQVTYKPKYYFEKLSKSVVKGSI